MSAEKNNPQPATQGSNGDNRTKSPESTQRHGDERQNSSESTQRPDIKSMPQPSYHSQRYDDRILLRPGGHVELRTQSKDTSKRPASSPSTTQIPPDTMRPSESQRPIRSTAYNLQASTTGRIVTQKGVTYHAPTTDVTFEIAGKKYNRVSLLSSSTGEAEIFIVSYDGQGKGSASSNQSNSSGNQYILKLYFRGYYPSTDVLDKLKENNGNGRVVDILDYGRWTSSSGEERFGVLMPYYTGGGLHGGEFRGKPKDLERFAIQAVRSIQFCHEQGILHKDIKPSNFIYTDDTKQSVVLADFGIASTFIRDLKGNVIPFVNINQDRTYIYASPEIFNLTVQRSDGRVEVEYSDVKSDFFALGMTLLVLWMGEAPFSLLDERSLLKLKRGDRSGLPYPEEIPEHTRNLIKGLTIADPKQRWGLAEFEKWIKCEDKPVQSLNDTKTKPFRILYSGSKNQIATSVKQLSEYMLDDPALGEQYLYSGKISRWLTEAGMPEWQIRIDTIVNKQYPKSKRSGLLAACYKMNPDLPFVGLKGQKCYNNLQLARELTRNAEAYSMALREWDAPLYIYFNSHGIDLGNRFQQQFKSNPWVALWRLAYALSPECEFPFWSTTRNSLVWCATVDNLIEEFASSMQDRYATFNVRTPIGKYTPMLLEDECFITWLSFRDPSLAETIKTAVAEEHSHGADFYTYIFYLLDQKRNFFYEKSTETFYTAAHLGALINRDLIDYLVIGRHNNNQHFYDEQHRRSEQLAHYRDTKLYYYLKSRGDYKDKFEYIDKCFDIHSNENRNKTGPYNNKLAAIKVCHAFAGGSFYYFPVSDITVNNVDQLADVPVSELHEELHRGFLLEWLAVQYQENPVYDDAGQDVYQRESLKFMERLESIDPTYPEVVRFKKSHENVNNNAEKLHISITKVKKLKYVLMSFAALIAVMIIVMLWGGVHSLPNDDTFTYNWRTMAYIALPLFVLMVVPPIQSLVNDLTKGFLGSPLLFAIVVSNVIVVGWEVLRLYIMPYAYVSLPIIYGLFLVWVLYSCFVKRRLNRRKYAACINPDFNTTHIEPLFFTWNSVNDPYREFDSSIIKETKAYSAYLKDIYYKLLTSVKVFSVVIVVLFAAFCLLSLPVSYLLYQTFPSLKFFGGGDMLEQYDNSDTVMLYVCDVQTALSVRSTPSARAKVIGTLNDGDIVEVVGFDGDYAKILFDGNVAYVTKSYIHPLE